MQEVEVKTTQRDALHARCEKLKNGLKSLIGDDDAMLNTPPVITTTALNGKK